MTSEQATARRRYSGEFKAQVLAECEVPGASAAKVAMSHGINTNVVHGWRKRLNETLKSNCAAARRGDDEDHMACLSHGRLHGLDARAAAVIRVDCVWLSIAPLDMRAEIGRAHV